MPPGIVRLKQHLQNPDYYPLWLVLLSTLSSLLLYWPVHGEDPTLIFRYWDGPNYLYVARTLYQIPVNHPFAAYETTPAYFACHLPLYPLLIRLLASLMGYLGAMLAVTLICSGLATVLFYYLLRESGAVQNPFWSAVVSLYLPARWLIYHSVGATEPLFLALIFGSMLCWQRGRHGWAMALVGLSSITRIVGVLVAMAYLLNMLHQRQWRQLPWLLLTPIPLLLVFSFYAYHFGDFWAYFSWNHKLLSATPFEVLFSYAQNNNPHHAELYMLMYIAYGTGVLLLWRWPLFFWYGLVFWLFNIFVFHEDLSRYYLPISHLTLIVAYDRIFSQRAFQMMFPLLVFLTYLYAWPMLQQNVMVNWLWPGLLKALQS
ncbi:MAG: hypothetical protein IGS03_10400 [Candidatus Sericytochromatia bacterium]|nr:hypothetical protein [Candidatus Sericytochromatia bacterium]